MAPRLLAAVCFSLSVLVALPFSVATGADPAHLKEKKDKAVVNSSAAIKGWCKKRSFGYFRDKELTPYNWTASWWDEGSFIVVKGEWRVERERVQVTCRAERGQTLRQAVMEVEYAAQP